jgi:hypothetical protein
MGRVHETPEQALDAHRALGASTSVAIHFGTFELADDGEVEAVEHLHKAIEAASIPLRFWTLDFGEGREVPASP